MRLLLTLEIQNSNVLPINYNYPLSAAIYKLLKFGSTEFASFLHDIGYKLNGKTYKLFSFALVTDKIKFGSKCIYVSSKQIRLYISSPLVDDFIQNFVIGTFHQQKIEISDGEIKLVFLIRQVETLLFPQLANTSEFILLSPMVLSTVKENGGNFSQYYFRCSDDIDDINRVLNQNLINKYELINSRKYEGSGLILRWDEKYISRKLSENKRLTKKISIVKKGERPIEIIGIEVPFTLTGDVELMRVGYDCGFGEKNSMGFGLAEMI